MIFSSLLLSAVLVMSGAAATRSDQSQSASVKEAQAAVVDALNSHDRAAFERGIDADAVFFLPTLSQGREAILKSWIMFLVPSNASMALSPADAVVSSSQDLAYTTGTFLFTVQNNGKATTAMSGSYLAVWRLLEGKWMLKAFAGAGERPAPSTPAGTPAPGTGGTANAPIDPARLSNGGGLGPYRFGMQLEEVRKVEACRPYMDVRTTGGLECPNYEFEGRKINISFIFTSNLLRRIQLWIYEGESEKDARKAADFGIEFLKRTAGGAHMYGLGPDRVVDGESIVKALKNGQATGGRGVIAELQTPSSDSLERWFSRVTRTPTPNGDWFGVFLFVEARLPTR